MHRLRDRPHNTETTGDVTVNETWKTPEEAVIEAAYDIIKAGAEFVNYSSTLRHTLNQVCFEDDRDWKPVLLNESIPVAKYSEPSHIHKKNVFALSANGFLYSEPSHIHLIYTNNPEASARNR